MVLFLTPRAAEFTRSRCWPATQELVTLLPLSFSARIVWSRSTNVTVLTCPSDMRGPISEVSISLYPPLGARYWSAISTPTTATTIHSHGPRKIRLTSMSRGYGPDLLPAQTIDHIDGTRGFNERPRINRSAYCPLRCVKRVSEGSRRGLWMTDAQE